MIPGIIPAHNRTIILVRGARCIVARYRQTAPYRFEIEPATNWQDLEDDARAEWADD